MPEFIETVNDSGDDEVIPKLKLCATTTKPGIYSQ